MMMKKMKMKMRRRRTRRRGRKKKKMASRWMEKRTLHTISFLMSSTVERGCAEAGGHLKEQMHGEDAGPRTRCDLQ